MELDEIERLVRETLEKSGEFTVSKVLDRGYLSLTITPPPGADTLGVRSGRALARFWTSGVEAFFLVLDERFRLQDFDWELQGQTDIVRLMTTLAVAYLQGQGVEGESKGTFGRRRRHLDIELNGEVHRFVSNS